MITDYTSGLLVICGALVFCVLAAAVFGTIEKWRKQ